MDITLKSLQQEMMFVSIIAERDIIILDLNGQNSVLRQENEELKKKIIELEKI